MKSKDFCYWLKGFLTDKNELTKDDCKKIREHLNSVFQHDIDPSFPSGFQSQLNKIHNDNISTDTFNQEKILIRC